MVEKGDGMSNIGEPIPAPVPPEADILTVRDGCRALSDKDGHLTSLGRLTLTVVCASVFLTALDQTVVVTALPSMSQDLNVPITQPNRLAWIVSGYLLGYVIAMPLMGR